MGCAKLYIIIKKMFEETGCMPGRDAFTDLLRRNGFAIDKPTAHGLLKKTAGLFDKLYEAMRQAVKEDKYLKCDETYHKILVKADDNDGKGSRKGYIWVIIAVHLGLVYFFYDDGSRSENIILDELKGYEGTIQSDVLNRCAEMPNGAPPEAFRNLLPDRWTKKEQGE